MKRSDLRLKRLRTSRGWTQETLARKVGVSRVTIARVEIGYSRPSLRLLERLAKALKTDVASLTGGTMEDVRAFIETEPGHFSPFKRVRKDKKLSALAIDTATLRLEALAQEMALEIIGMHALGAEEAAILAGDLIDSALTGEQSKTPYEVLVQLKEGGR